MVIPNHIYSVRARYADVDQMGVVYHARYFEWFEAARTELLRSMGISYREPEEGGFFMPVVEARCRYRRSVLYDEVVCISTRVGELSRSKIRLEYIVRGEEEEKIRAEGYTLHCYVNREGRPIRAPLNFHELIKSF